MLEIHTIQPDIDDHSQIYSLPMCHCMEYMGYSAVSCLDGFIDRQLGQMCMNLDNLDNLDLIV